MPFLDRIKCFETLEISVHSFSKNFGKFNKLSSVEAVVGALFITGHIDQAKDMMGKFTWGHTFIELNMELFKSYSVCHTMEDIENVYLEFDINPNI